ncbi:GAS2-like protein 1 [Watersipora subatra]|uniref:GAS2-like protein 1 n=1 Tax=Watersipora subatra TaxID=2589382 RepID=UPI00355AE9E2
MPASLDTLDCESLNSSLSSPPSPGSPVSPTHSLHKLDRKGSVRPYESKDAYLHAMKEDLAVWFNDLYNTSLTADNLLPSLQDGTFLCHHANNVKSYIEASSHKQPSNIPDILYRTGVKAGSFQARDNLANFIAWVRHHLGVNDVLLFESDDLVMMKNEKNVILCILEVARRGARYGMLAPMLVQLEQEIDEMEEKIKRVEGRRNSQGFMHTDAATVSDTDSDKASLDEWVQSVVRRCTCPKQFPLINVSRGKYRIGYTQNIVFVRILRKHVMIRVGGGWDTLEHYMDKHDPCRCLKPAGDTNSLKRSARHKTSIDVDTRHAVVKSSMGSQNRSHSVSALNIPDDLQAPSNTVNKSGSTDLLSSDLLITRDDSGRHSIDDSSRGQDLQRSTKFQHGKSAGSQKRVKPRRSSLSGSPVKDMVSRSSSPSHDLVKKWKQTFKVQASSTPIKEDNNNNNRKHSYSNSVSMASQRTRSHSRARTLSQDSGKARSRSYSRAATPSPSRFIKENKETLKVSILASPRKDKRHAQSTQPTRIPVPLYNSNAAINNGMISSTSTCNSMDSLKTI